MKRLIFTALALCAACSKPAPAPQPAAHDASALPADVTPAAMADAVTAADAASPVTQD